MTAGNQCSKLQIEKYSILLSNETVQTCKIVDIIMFIF